MVVTVVVRIHAHMLLSSSIASVTRRISMASILISMAVPPSIRSTITITGTATPLFLAVVIPPVVSLRQGSIETNCESLFEICSCSILLFSDLHGQFEIVFSFVMKSTYEYI